MSSWLPAARTMVQESRAGTTRQWPAYDGDVVGFPALGRDQCNIRIVRLGHLETVPDVTVL
jgi:hypothetical protein